MKRVLDTYLNFIPSNENQSSKYVNGPDAKHEHYINAMHKLTRYVDKKKLSTIA